MWCGSISISRFGCTKPWWLLVLTSSNSVQVCHQILQNQAVQHSQQQHLLQLAVLRPLNWQNRLWSGSSSCSINCPVLVPSQHLLVLVHRLNFPTMLLKCALVQFWISLLSNSGRLARLDIHFCPRSPLIWFQPQHHRRPDNGQAEQNGKKLNVAYFSEWN